MDAIEGVSGTPAEHAEQIGRFLHAVQMPRRDGHVTDRWAIHSGNAPTLDARTILCAVSWHAPWRRYAVLTNQPIMLDAECMRSLADFCERKTAAHRAARR